MATLWELLGININININIDSQKTAEKRLYEICKDGLIEAMKDWMTQLKDHPDQQKALLNYRLSTNAWTPLMIAAFHGKIEFIKYLLQVNRNAMLNNPRVLLDIHYQSPSGTTVFDIIARDATVINTSALEDLTNLLNREKERRLRLENGPNIMGYHETNTTVFEMILADHRQGIYPMIGGAGGFFGGGIYFAGSEKESSSKTLHHGRGFQCLVKLGKTYTIESMLDLGFFADTFFDIDKDRFDIPVDVMQKRLLEYDYDSVSGIKKVLPYKSDEITHLVQTGTEYVVYSADQVELKEAYIIHYKYLASQLRYSVQWVKFPSLEEARVVPVKPIASQTGTEDAKYYKYMIQGNHAKNVISLNDMRLAIKPFNDFQNGDLIDYSYEKDYEEDPTYIRLGIFHRCRIPTTLYEECIPFELFTQNNVNYIIEDLQKPYNHTLLFPQHYFNTILGVQTGAELLNYYRYVLTTQMQLQQVAPNAFRYKIWIEIINSKKDRIDWLDILSNKTTKDGKMGLFKLIERMTEYIQGLNKGKTLKPENVQPYIVSVWNTCNQYSAIYTDGRQYHMVWIFTGGRRLNRFIYSQTQTRLQSALTSIKSVFGRAKTAAANQESVLNEMIVSLQNSTPSQFIIDKIDTEFLIEAIYNYFTKYIYY
jgi:hypothetical protein